MEQVDERQLAQLFQAASEDGPPASFGHSDVVAASRRATARRRAGIAGGSALGVAVLLGGVLIGNGLFDGSNGGELSSAGGVAQSPVQPRIESDPRERADASPPQQSELSLPGDQSQGTGGSGKVVPWPGLGNDDARAGCGQADRELAVALAAQLPAADPANAVAVPDACPPEARSVAVPVDDGDAAGWIYLVLAPVRGDGPSDHPLERAADGAVGHQRLTPSGLLLVVLSVPQADGGPAPFAADTARLAEEIGLKY